MIGLFKKKKRDSDWINSYPVYDAPHVGVGRTLSELQARENLDYLLTNKSVRIDALSTVLQTFNIDLVAGFANESPGELISQLYNWSEEHWATYGSKEHTRQDWLKSSRRGGGLIYSVAMDTAIVLGDLLIQYRPSYSWGVDLDSENLTMASFRRCVVMAPMLTHDHMAIADVEQAVAERIFDANKPHWRWENQWQRMLDGYLSGAHEGASNDEIGD